MMGWHEEGSGMWHEEEAFGGMVWGEGGTLALRGEGVWGGTCD